jgi:hypothetical protein
MILHPNLPETQFGTRYRDGLAIDQNDAEIYEALGDGSQTPGDVPPSQCNFSGCTAPVQTCSDGHCLTNNRFTPYVSAMMTPTHGSGANGNGIGGGGGSNSASRSTTAPPTNKPPQGNQHQYVVSRVTQCTAGDAFNKLKAPGMSAPGAPEAQEGFTGQVTLAGNNGNNRMSQAVNSATMTLVNTTLEGHQFYPGSVTFQVAPLSGGGSSITVTGTGTGNNPEWNDVVGLAFFGSAADNVAWQCGSSGTIPNP